MPTARNSRTTTRNSKPAQKQEPEIHLNGDIHVHVYDQGTSVAVDQGRAVLDEINKQARQMPMEASAPINGTSKQPNDADMALDYVMNELQKLDAMVGILDERSKYYRSQFDPGAIPNHPPFANDSSSVVIQRLQTMFYRVADISARVGFLIDGYQSRMEEMF